jgi:hypothetical protein
MSAPTAAYQSQFMSTKYHPESSVIADRNCRYPWPLAAFFADQIADQIFVRLARRST